jgi:hypothetical protein
VGRSGQNGRVTDAAIEGIPASRTRLHHRFVTAEAIYGTILFCAVVAAAEDETDSPHILFTGVLASLVLWFAHVVAMTVARYGNRDGQEAGVRAALGEGLHHSTGVLIGPFVPLLVMLLGVVGVLHGDVPYYAALFSGVGVLVVLGLVSCRERGVSWPLSVAGGLAAGAAGFLAIIIKATLLE